MVGWRLAIAMMGAILLRGLGLCKWGDGIRRFHGLGLMHRGMDSARHALGGAAVLSRREAADQEESGLMGPSAYELLGLCLIRGVH